MSDISIIIPLSRHAHSCVCPECAASLRAELNAQNSITKEMVDEMELAIVGMEEASRKHNLAYIELCEAKKHLGLKLTQARKLTGIRPRSIAKLAGIGGAEYSAMEGGRLDHQNLKKLWKVSAAIEAAIPTYSTASEPTNKQTKRNERHARRLLPRHGLQVRGTRRMRMRVRSRLAFQAGS